MRLASRILLAFGLIIGIFAGIVFAQSSLQRRTPTDVMAGYGLPFVPSPQSEFGTDRLSLLMLGIDYSYTAKDIETSSQARTDTIKAVSLTFPTPDLPNGSIAILSVPRDMGITLPNGDRTKINAAYGGYTDTRMAAHASERTVARFLGIPGFGKYITLRIDATKELIDAIGGIDVTPDETMNYDDNWGHLHIHFIGGKHYHMDGNAAVSYSRFRHDACSDPCRIKRQDQIIRITMAKLERDKVNDLVHINALIDVVRRNVYTDLTPREMVSLAWAFDHADLKKVVTDQVPYTSTVDLACCGNLLVADDAAKQTLVRKMFLAAPITSAPPSASAIAAVLPSSVHVVVENGSGIRGTGRRAADALRRMGFVVDAVGNASNFGYETTQIEVHSTQQPLAGEAIRAKLALRTAIVRPEPSPSPGSGDVTLVVGRDFANASAAAPK